MTLLSCSSHCHTVALEGGLVAVWYQLLNVGSNNHCMSHNTANYLPDVASPNGGTIAGAVMGTLTFLALLAVVVVVVLLVINSRTRHRRKQMEKIQLDILGM